MTLHDEDREYARDASETRRKLARTSPEFQAATREVARASVEFDTARRALLAATLSLAAYCATHDGLEGLTTASTQEAAMLAMLAEDADDDGA